MSKFAIAIHGGAGTILKEEMTPELELAYRKSLQQALDAGYAVLENGGSALEAVKNAIMILEDEPLFNAGKGSVFTKDGLNEMDACIMDGANLEAGAIAAVQHVRNPIVLAEKVMLNSGHVFLSGQGAEEFARQQEIRMEPAEYFFSQHRYDQLLRMKDSDQFQLDHSTTTAHPHTDKKFGTVGAVACDKSGNIAAGTSTGGMTNKQFGRIGDSPMIGAGTYANNKTCAISCTGHGEIFIRAVAAYDVSCMMEYRNMNLQDACNEVVMNKLVAMEGEGGLIGIDAMGNSSLVFNSAGMYRGERKSDGTNRVAIYGDDNP